MNSKAPFFAMFVMMNPLVIIVSEIFIGLIGIDQTDAKRGYARTRYFYDPFTDWDREYYDSSLEDLRLGNVRKNIGYVVWVWFVLGLVAYTR